MGLSFCQRMSDYQRNHTLFADEVPISRHCLLKPHGQFPMICSKLGISNKYAPAQGGSQDLKRRSLKVKYI